MRFAYADPPYLGMCAAYRHEHGEGGCWNDPETHRKLIERLETYDGWALSMHLPSLRTILPMLPENARLMAWCKTFGTMFPGVHPQYAWEPVAIRLSDRKRLKGEISARDWVATFPVLGFFGAKPPTFTAWVLDCLNVQDGDTFDDLFYGSGAVSEAYESWRNQRRLFA